MPMLSQMPVGLWLYAAALIRSFRLYHMCLYVGRVYGLDIGKDHHNPQCEQVGEKHKHRWTERFRDKEAYVPHDITAPASDPVAVWQQFCIEARLEHNGKLLDPPPHQTELPL
jgi:hypothetical protein